ncbi:hypothetical protein B2G74_22195 [Burkholderia sp. A27]|nr:hypothetical protein B2G74_22195 [Burkholderia sp. A27]
MSNTWQTQLLGEHCYVKARIGWRGLSASEYIDDGPYLVAGKHVEDGLIDWTACDHISEFRYRESSEIALADGDVILTKDGTIGRVARVDRLPGKATINGTMMLLRPHATLHYRYLYHVLNGRGFKKLIDDKVSGSSIPHIFQRDVVTLPISFPPIGQQRLLADILDTLDIAIRETEAIIEKLKPIKKGLLHDLLTRGIDENGELRPPQNQAPHLYRQSPLGWVPAAWSVFGLSDVALPSRDVLKTGPFGSSLKGEHFRTSGRPVVTIGSLGASEFIEDALLFISEATAHVLKDYELLPGDIAFSRVADVGRSVVVEEGQRGWIMSSNFMRISVDCARVLPKFLQAVLAFDNRTKQQIRKTVNSAGRDVANSEVLMGLRFPWPSIDEQQRIVDRVQRVHERILLEQAQRGKLVNCKKGLMDDLLTGRVRVTPLLP